MLRTALRSAAGVVAVSTAGREMLLARTSLVPEDVFVAPLGVDDRWWQPTPPPSDGYVLAVGRDLARDYATFTQALEGLDARGVIVAKEENLRGISIPDNVEGPAIPEPAVLRTMLVGRGRIESLAPTYVSV